jgi:hypothetical protein
MSKINWSRDKHLRNIRISEIIDELKSLEEKAQQKRDELMELI